MQILPIICGFVSLCSCRKAFLQYRASGKRLQIQNTHEMRHIFPEPSQWEWSSLRHRFWAPPLDLEEDVSFPSSSWANCDCLLGCCHHRKQVFAGDTRLAESHLLKSLGRLVPIHSLLYCQRLLVAVCHVWNANATLKIYFQGFSKVCLFAGLFVVPVVQFFLFCFCFAKSWNSHGKRDIFKDVLILPKGKVLRIWIKESLKVMLTSYVTIIHVYRLCLLQDPKSTVSFLVMCQNSSFHL